MATETQTPQSAQQKRVQMTPEQLHELTYKLMTANKYDEAEDILQQMLDAVPMDANGWVKLGICYRMAKKYDAAESCYQKAYAISPALPSLDSNYANLLSDMERYDEAIPLAEKVLAEKPDDVGLQKNLAFCYREDKQFDKALELLRKIYAEDPKHPQIRFELAFVMLYMGLFDEAWDHYEFRPRSGFSQMVLKGEIPRYNGESLKDKKLLVLGEQGFGDTILMLRFLPDLIKKAGRVDLLVNPALHPLLQNLDVHLVAEENIQAKSYDYCIEMMGLPRLIEKDWANWPKQPELSIPDRSLEKFARIEKQIPPETLKIGIVWSGSVTFKQNHKRSAGFERFADLVRANPEAQFYSFQKGPREDDLKTYGRGSMLPLGHLFEDFSETAAALKQMDLIIMTDSAVAHLAGTLDVPVLNLLNYKPYWLYFPEEKTTALYDSWRFIRQKKSADWDQVFGDTQKILTALIKANTKKRLNAKALLKVIDKTLK